MQFEAILSGFGGQGALFAGQILAYAALDEGRHVTWLPSYGPEMRGGTAHCVVIISDEEIGSPIVRNPRAAIVLNIPSMDKYEPLVRPHGVLVVNSSLVLRAPVREDLHNVLLPATEIAEELGDPRLANIVMLGGLIAVQPIVQLDSAKLALETRLPARHRQLLPANIEGICRGADAAMAQAAALAS